MPQATYLEAIRQGLLRLGIFALFSFATLPLNAQKIGGVDLTHDAPTVATEPPVPPECEATPVGFSHGDGFILPQGTRPKLELNVVSLSDSKPALGEVVEAEIMLKNIDNADIVIPWVTDPNVVNRPLKATHHEHESAGLRIWIKDANGQNEFLRSLSIPLYGSDAQAQSTLKLLSGQWVTIRIKFQFVIGSEGPSRSLAPGLAELRVEWWQGHFTWERNGCQVETGYSSYSSFYEQKTDPVKVFLFSSKDEQEQANTQK